MKARVAIPEPKRRHPIGILATCCIPWDRNHHFLSDVFRREVRHLLKGLTKNVYIFGTAGEGHAVTDRQFDEICTVFREETNRPGVSAMVGVIGLSQGQIIERIDRARAMGFRLFQISLPSWGAVTFPEMRRFFRDVCGRFPDCGFLHYNLMRTKRLVTPEEYGVLADENPNLVATKNSTPDMNSIRGLLTHAPQLTHFLTENAYAYGCLVGRCGYLISIASINFKVGKAYFKAGQERDVSRLINLQKELMALTGELVGMGLPEAHMDGAFDQMFCRMHDAAFPLRLLPPYASVSEPTYRRIVEMIRSKYPRMLPAKAFSLSLASNPN